VSTTIRGVRINMAAAICWENYMPLLRQSLYAQNINLYLAPTADGRDTWLSLMRTVGNEGRCFVVSSNMCVREPSPQTNGTTAYASLRRGSTVTEGDGVEMALPPPAQGHGAKDEQRGTHTVHSKPQRKRRKSVLDEDGNEIVLCCDREPMVHEDAIAEEEGGETQTERDAIAHGGKSAGFSQDTIGGGRRQHSGARRKSVFDEDGNEIVLCCAKAGDTTTDGGGVPKATEQSTTTVAGAAGFVSRGGSAICSPFGDVLAGPQWEDDEGIIYADVDFEDCIRGRLDLDVGGSYSRFVIPHQTHERRGI